MNLRAYLDSLPRGGIAEFAKQIGVSTVYLSQLAAGQDGREASPSLCVVIEVESNGAVPRQDLRRDWKAIWPELTSSGIRSVSPEEANALGIELKDGQLRRLRAEAKEV